MKENVENPENVNKSSFDFEYVDFESEKETWNRYKLEDGAILKSKFILINILAPKGIEEIAKKAKEEKGIVQLNLSLQSSNVIGVEVPPTLIGAPSNAICSVKELEESIVVADLDFETISESQNRYRLNFKEIGEIMYLKVKSSPVKVSKTGKFDKFGIPLYVANFTAVVSISS